MADEELRVTGVHARRRREPRPAVGSQRGARVLRASALALRPDHRPALDALEALHQAAEDHRGLLGILRKKTELAGGPQGAHGAAAPPGRAVAPTSSTTSRQPSKPTNRCSKRLPRARYSRPRGPLPARRALGRPGVHVRAPDGARYRRRLVVRFRLSEVLPHAPRRRRSRSRSVSRRARPLAAARGHHPRSRER